MSRKPRINAAAKEMVDTAIEAALLVEGCENKHKLTQAEACDVLCGVVYHYLWRDGEINAKTVPVRLSNFLDQLVDYVENVSGITLSEDGNS